MSATDSCIEFLRKLIRTRSLPGEEGDIARLVQSEMLSLGFDDVRSDEAGNIIGLCRGEGLAPAMMLNTHLDHVDVGDAGGWPFHPYAAEIHAGKIWGRGAVDIKGPLASQVHAVGQLIGRGTRPHGDVYVTAVVQEEVGGLGARHLLDHLQPPLVVVGEPSKNQLKRGHRGRTELQLHITGKSVHASVPERAVQPLEVLSRFVLGLGALEMMEDPDLGNASVACTLLKTDQTSANVTPGEVWLTCDCRTIPGEDGERLRKRLLSLAETSLVEGAAVELRPVLNDLTSYTGLRWEIPAEHPAFLLPVQHPAVAAALQILRQRSGVEDEPGVWRFATDGGHFAQAGLTVIGFGPGDDLLAHTSAESIEIDALDTGMRAYQELALAWPKLAMGGAEKLTGL